MFLFYLFDIMLLGYDDWSQTCWHLIKYTSACEFIIAVYDCFIEIIDILSNYLFYFQMFIWRINSKKMSDPLCVTFKIDIVH
jgi:hypothetical protein